MLTCTNPSPDHSWRPVNNQRSNSSSPPTPSFIEENHRRFSEATALPLKPKLGETAIGTGMNGHPPTPRSGGIGLTTVLGTDCFDRGQRMIRPGEHTSAEFPHRTGLPFEPRRSMRVFRVAREAARLRSWLRSSGWPETLAR